jgi:hypothetical protein
LKPVERHEVVDYATYEDRRMEFRRQVMRAKAARRFHLGDHFTFLFENHLTVLYQIQEMIRTERIVRESEILHEIQTYNELLGKDGELGCTLLIEIEDPAVRDRKLREWWRLPESMYLLLEDGTRVPATFDDRQRGDHRLSSVQYVKFDTKGKVPTAIGVDLPGLQIEAPFTDEQREALGADLNSGTVAEKNGV